MPLNHCALQKVPKPKSDATQPLRPTEALQKVPKPKSDATQPLRPTESTQTKGDIVFIWA